MGIKRYPGPENCLDPVAPLFRPHLVRHQGDLLVVLVDHRASHRVYYSRDIGFSDHFRTIGDKLGPFDLSIIKVGAYGPGASWLDIHIILEHAIDAHIAVRARRLLPVHWATFNLAHDWDQPIKRALAAARKHNVDLATPRIGEVVVARQPFESQLLWEQPD